MNDLYRHPKYNNPQPVNQPNSSIFNFTGQNNPTRSPLDAATPWRSSALFDGLNTMGEAGPTSPIDGTPSFFHKLLDGNSNQIGPSNMDYLFGSDETGTGLLSPLVTGAGSIMGYLGQKQQNEDYGKYTSGLINNANQEIALQTEAVQKQRHSEAMTNFNRDPNTYSNPGLYDAEYRKNNPVV